MSPERLIKIEKIFLAVIEIEDRAARARFLDEACAGDVELKKQVEKLVRQDAEAGTFLHRPIAEESAIHVFADLLDDDPLVGEKIGKYEIIREIGAGGMGAVYLARRIDGSFEKRVAIKIVKRGMDTKFILRRFRQERQVLALLNHPFIAPLLDGGTTADGLPYFVMEYVEGEPLYKYADGESLNVRQRLELFIKICSAVEYAHQNQVIHRDLKPSNILIKTDGSPRLLDFGIAKVFNPDFQGDITIDPTQTAVRLMTPEYASPEQVKGEAVSAASDIYSLGVVLYELLTGHRPYRFKNRAAHEIARVICEEEPVPPSEAEKEGEKDSLNRISPSPRLPFSSSQLKGEIERVILKCLRKKPNERYQTAAALIEDITRFLSGERVQAEAFRSPTETDEAIVDVEKSIAVLPLKILGAADGDDEYLGIGLADALISRLARVPRFVVRPTSSVLKFQRTEPVDSFAAGRDLDVEFVVEGTIRRAGERIRVSVKLLSVAENTTRWAENFDERMTDVLEIEDSISERVAATLVPRLTGEEQKQISKRGTNSPEAYEAYLRGRHFWNQFTPEALPKALEAFEKAVALDPNYAAAYAGIADFYNWATNFGVCPPREGNEKMRAAVVRALEIDPHLPEALAAMGLVRAFFDYDWTEAERLFRRSIEVNPHQAITYERYAAMLNALGRTNEAGEKAALAGKLDPLSIRSVTLFAWNFYQQRRFADALARADEVIELNPRYFLGRILRGNILVELGRAAEAIPEIKRGIELEPRVPFGYYMLCFALAALGQMDEARRTLRDLENLPNSFASSFYLGLCSIALGDRDAAFEWLDKAIDARQTLVAYLATDAKFDAVRDDERFNDLLRKTNRHALVRRTKPQPKTFAVLPFNTLRGGDTEERFLGIGLADALITRLSTVQNLVVRPTGAVVRYADKIIELPQVGRELKVAYLLEGSIRRVGSRVRLSTRLFDVSAGASVWAENFDEEYTDILTLEDSISERVAESLLPQLSGEEKSRAKKRETRNPQAYEHYLRGRFYRNQVTPDGLIKANENFRRAIELDANYAAAHAAMADCYFYIGAFGVASNRRQCWESARNSAEKAISLDDESAEAHAVLGFIRLGLDFDSPQSVKVLKHAVRLSPNYAAAHMFYSSALVWDGQFPQAVEQAEKLIEIDPLTPFNQQHLAWILYQTRRYDEALRKAREAVRVFPDFAHAFWTAAWILTFAGAHQEALENVEKAIALSGNASYAVAGKAAVYAAAGEQTEARRILRALENAPVEEMPHYQMAAAYALLGEKDAAFRFLEQAIATRNIWIIWFKTDSLLDNLRDDPRYAGLQRLIQKSA